MNTDLSSKTNAGHTAHHLDSFNAMGAGMMNWGTRRQPIPGRGMRIFPFFQKLQQFLPKKAEVSEAATLRRALEQDCSCRGMRQCGSCDARFRDMYSDR